MKLMFRMVVLIAGVFLFAALPGKAQTWGCGEKDYKCQLDVRMKALQDNPKDPENYYNLAIVFQRAKAFKQAVETYTMYLSIPGVATDKRADGFNNRGISYRALKNAELAMADYNQAIELKPTDASFFVNRANLHAQNKKNDLAFADYEKAVGINPKYFSTYAQRGILYSNLSRTGEALKDFAKAIELEPAYPEPYYNRGTIYSDLKEYAKAIPDYTKYISLIDDSEYLADGHINRGIAYAYTDNLQRAVEDFTKVIELSPKRVAGYRARALAYRQLKKESLAQADEQKAADLSVKPN